MFSQPGNTSLNEANQTSTLMKTQPCKKMKIQLVSYHCRNNLLHARWLKTPHIYSLTSALGQRQGVSLGSVSGGAVLPPEALGENSFFAICSFQSCIPRLWSLPSSSKHIAPTSFISHVITSHHILSSNLPLPPSYKDI